MPPMGLSVLRPARRPRASSTPSGNDNPMPAAARKRLSIIPSHSFHGAAMLRNQMSSTGPTIPTTTIGSNQRRVAKPPTRRPMIAETTTRAVSTVGPGVVVRREEDDDPEDQRPDPHDQLDEPLAQRQHHGLAAGDPRICWTYPARTPP